MIVCALFSSSACELLQHHLNARDVLRNVQRVLVSMSFLVLATNISGSIAMYAVDLQILWGCIVIIPFCTCLWLNLAVSSYSYVTLRTLLLQLIDLQSQM